MVENGGLWFKNSGLAVGFGGFVVGNDGWTVGFCGFWCVFRWLEVVVFAVWWMEMAVAWCNIRNVRWLSGGKCYGMAESMLSKQGFINLNIRFLSLKAVFWI